MSLAKFRDWNGIAIGPDDKSLDAGICFFGQIPAECPIESRDSWLSDAFGVFGISNGPKRTTKSWHADDFPGIAIFFVGPANQPAVSLD